VSRRRCATAQGASLTPHSPWFFAEAYKYRRLHECFSISKYWKDYDVFFRQKCDTFSRSSTAVFELSTRFAEPFHYEANASDAEKLEARKLVFHELTQVCLWGNATDLSLLINMTEEDIKNLQSTGGEHLAATEKNILGNHIERIWNMLSKMKCVRRCVWCAAPRLTPLQGRPHRLRARQRRLRAVLRLRLR
jgi:hypothetical protein